MLGSDFNDYVVKDLLADVEGIFSRAMFGGYGLYKDGIIFGIIADDELYLKVDKTNKQRFESFGSHPFEYDGKKHKKIAMSYWVVPEDILENRALVEELVFQSAAINAAKKYPPKAKKKPKKSSKKRR